MPIVTEDVTAHRAGAKEGQAALRHHPEFQPRPLGVRDPLTDDLVALHADLQRTERVPVILDIRS